MSALLIGLSGPSSSGKTTIARLLRDIFPSTLILHEDDFYRPEEQLPKRNGLIDWDSANSIDFPYFISTLRHIRQYGTIPKELESKEDKNEVGESGVTTETVRKLQEQTQHWLNENNLGIGGHNSNRVLFSKICIVDGFLLFGQSVKEIRDELDVKVFLRTRFEEAKRRREARSGYVTLEGFWKDPPGYVDRVVWPAYVEEHAFLFEQGNVEGHVNKEIALQLGVEVCPSSGEWTIEQTLFWVVETIKCALLPGSG